jgi:CBS domain-containing protein
MRNAMQERARVPLREVMSRSPVTIGPDEPVHSAAALMRGKNVGSVLVVENGHPVGIVTERDIVTQVAAENRVPSTLLLKDIMSTPVVSVPADLEVADAAKVMSDRGIRRLAIVEDGRLVGVATENDILRVWPHLVEVTREFAQAGLLQSRVLEGHCESCGGYVTDLRLDRNLWTCGQCRSR